MGNKFGVAKFVNVPDDLTDYSKFVMYQCEEVDPDDGITTFRSIFGLQFRDGYMYKELDFNTFDTKEMKIPNNYKKKESTNEEWKLKYHCNPNVQVLTQDNPICKEIIDKYSSKKGFKHYFIHDNCGRPFIVYYKSNNSFATSKLSFLPNSIGVQKQHQPKAEVHIYAHDREKYFTRHGDWNRDEDKNKWMYIKHILSFNPIRIFIGKSPLNSMTEFSGGHGPRFDGNSILLQLSKTKYVSIGHEIYSFTTNHQIVEYISPVGNNDVPYPYAVDDIGQYYLMLDYNILKNIPEDKKEDAYQYYYKMQKITSVNQNQENLVQLEDMGYDIQQWYIYNINFNLTYHSWETAGKYYDDLKPEKYAEEDGVDPLSPKMQIKKADGILYEFTKEEFVDLMKKISEKCGFDHMQNIVTLQERL
jgi:hypothetical protein